MLIPDWQLIPIVRFADSPYFTCLTLSGSLNDKRITETILKNGGRIINYHQAFSNTLLGWRLLEMDILLIYPEAVNLPEYDDGGINTGQFSSQSIQPLKVTGYLIRCRIFLTGCRNQQGKTQKLVIE